MGRLTSFVDGIEELPAALARSLGDRLRTGTSVERIERDSSSQRWRILAGTGPPLDADHVVVATGADAAARLLVHVDGELAGLLTDIPWAPFAILCLGFTASAPRARLDGFGFLAPRGQGLRILGAVWDSSIFPGRAPADHVMVRVLIGGGSDPDAAALADQALVSLARADLSAACGLAAAPRFARVIRQVPGLPQYRIGHAERVEEIARRVALHPGLSLVGNSYRGLALNACIGEARKQADSLLAPAGRAPRPSGTNRPRTPA